MAEGYTIWISMGALLASLWAVFVSRRTMQLQILDSFQKLIIEKAKDCNAIYSNMPNEGETIGIDVNPKRITVQAITEVVISIQLIENALDRFNLSSGWIPLLKVDSHKAFLLKQLWFQLDPVLRTRILTDKFNGYPGLTMLQARQLCEIFRKINKAALLA